MYIVPLKSVTPAPVDCAAAVAPAAGYRYPAFMPHFQDYEPSADHLGDALCFKGLWAVISECTTSPLASHVTHTKFQVNRYRIQWPVSEGPSA